MCDFRDTNFISYKYSNRPYYLMPYDIIKSEFLLPNGGVSYYGKYFKSELGIFIYGRAFSNALLYLTNINDEIYYKRYVAHVPDDYVAKCKYCGKIRPFVSISKGFSGGIGGGYNFTDNIFCNNSCYLNYQYKFNNLRESIKYDLNSVSSQAKGRFTQWMLKGNPNDPCYFYIGQIDNYTVKFGVSSKDSRWTWHNEFLSFHKLLKGTREQVGSLERDLKIYLNINCEYIEFNRINELKKFIRSYSFNN